MNNKNSAYNELRTDLFCTYCGKQCKNLNSLNNHERLCIKNPKRYELPDHKGNNNPMYGKKAWNKGLTKETNDTVLNISETFKKNHELGKHKLPVIKEEPNIKRKEKLSKIAKESNHFWKYKRKHVQYYNGIPFDSSYEIEVVKSLDDNNIKWEKPKSFPYIDDKGINHTYTPDIYLTDYDIYLDPKNDFLIENINPNLGYKDTDKILWVEQQNNIKILIVDKDNLSWDNIKTMIEI